MQTEAPVKRAAPVDQEESKLRDLLEKAKIPEDVRPLVISLYRTQTGVEKSRDRFTITIGALTAEWVSATRTDDTKVMALRFIKHGTVFLDLAVHQGIGFDRNPIPIENKGGDWWLPEGLPYSNVGSPVIRHSIEYYSGLSTASLLDIPGHRSALPWLKACEGRDIPEGAIALGMIFHAFSNIAHNYSDKLGLATLRNLVCKEVYPDLPAEDYPIPRVSTSHAGPVRKYVSRSDDDCHYPGHGGSPSLGPAKYLSGLKRGHYAK
jgi:hypothetical protein